MHIQTDLPGSRHISSTELHERARKAVEVFHGLIPSLNAYARVLTGNPEVRVVLGKQSGSQTDGRTIQYRPPTELGLNLRHQREVCDRRDEAGQQQCMACRVRERVLSSIYHEISHIAFDSFENLTDAARARLVTESMKLWPSTGWAMHFKRKMLTVDFNKYSEVAMAISPYLHFLVNVLEDGRVNSRMFEARPGTRAMMVGEIVGVFNEGTERVNHSTGAIEVVYWREAPLNAQVMIGMLLVIEGVTIQPEWLDARVQYDLTHDAILGNHLVEARHASTMGEIFQIALPLFKRLQELGYLQMPEDPEPEPEPDPTPEDEETDDDDGEGEASEDGDASSPGGDGSSESGEAGDPSGDASSSGDGGDTDPEGSDGPGAGDSREGSRDENSDADAGSDDVAGDPAVDEAEGDEGDAPDGQPDEPGADGEPGSEPDAGGVEDESDSAGGADDSDGEDGAGEEGNVDAEPEGAADSTGGGQPEDAAPDSDGDGAGEVDDDLVDGAEGGDPDGEGLDGEEADRADADSADGGDLGGDDSDAQDAGVSETRDAPRPEASVETGSPEDVAEGLARFTGHDELDPGHADTDKSPQEDQVMDQAIDQTDVFDSPSVNIRGVRVSQPGDPGRGPWQPKPREYKLPESIVGPALLKARAVFDENKRGKVTPNIRSGRVHRKVLGRRAPTGDDRLFHKKSRPGKRDYFVLIGIDVSGSTWGEELLIEMKAAYAQAELLHRLGVKFAIYTHTGDSTSGGGMELLIGVVKEEHEPWDTKRKQRLLSIKHHSANLDGHTMEWYRKRLDQSSATDKILMYYTDGAMPLENFREELTILRRELKLCAARGYTVLGVGVKTDSPKKHGLDTVVIQSERDTSLVIEHMKKYLLK